MTLTSRPGGLNALFINTQLPAWLKHARAADLARLRDTQLDAQYSATGLAAWFTAASATQQQALLAAQAQLRLRKRSVAGLLRHFKGITEFAEPLLKARLKAEHGLDVDVNTAQWVSITREWTVNGRWQRLTVQRQSLLQAALQNFASDASFDADTCLSVDGQFSERNEVIRQPAVVTFDNPIAVSATEFAQLCHRLDLGGLYQAHLSEVYDLPLVASRIRYQSVELYQALLQVHVHIALMKGEISTAAAATLQAFATQPGSATWHGHALDVQALSMYGQALTGPWTLSGQHEGADKPVIVYLPGAPLYPLKEYPNLAAFKDDLRISLTQPAYQQLFCGYVGRDEQAAFLNTLKQNVFHRVAGEAEPVYNPTGSLKLRATALPADPFKALQDQHLLKLKADARALAVPSAEADAQASAARIAYWQGIGVDGLNLAALFVPALGPVMALVFAEQMVLGAVDGAQAWQNGDRASAWAHFEALGLNLAIAAGLGAGAAVTDTMAASAVLDELVIVELPSGARRLWRPDLKPYATDIELGGARPDHQGVYALGDRRYVRIEEHLYEVAQDSQGHWRVQAPGADVYQPQLASNGHGAWQALGEQPLAWSRQQLLRRIGHLTDGLADQALAEAADISGVSDDLLRAMHVDRQPLPVSLADTLKRLQLDRRVTVLASAMRDGNAVGAEMAYVAPLAVELPHWPGRPIEVFEGPELWGESQVYGRERFKHGVSIKLTRAQLYAGELPQVIIEAFNEDAADAFFGSSVERSARLEVLRGRLAERIEARRAQLRDSLQASERAPLSVAAKCLLRDFPDLSDDAATHLLAGADSQTLLSLNATPGRVPLRMAERARLLRGRLRISRAIDGLAHAVRAGLDSDRLALHLLEKLPGWLGKVRIELRAERFEGQQLAAIGAVDDPLRVLVRGEGFAVYDQAGHELGMATQVQQALLKALPDAARVGLGLQIHDVQALSEALLAQALADRDSVALVLGESPRRPWFKVPQELDGERGYTLSGDPQSAAAALAARYSPALVQRGRGLYPALSDEAIIALFEELALDESGLLAELQKRQADLAQLRTALEQWSGAASGPAAQARQSVAQAIERAFRRQCATITARDGIEVGYELDLRGMSIEQLPSFTADMRHVASLNLRSMGLAEVPVDFLRNFTELRWLNLADNALHQLPESINAMGGLTKLLLRGNRIVLDVAAKERLATLYGLKILDLSNNPIGLLPEVATLRELRGLLLSGTGIETWPPGVFELEQLEVLDLRANRITDIPTEVLEPASTRAAQVRKVNAVTTLHGNPLSQASLTRLGVYRQHSGLEFGVAPRLRLTHAPAVENPAARWLVKTPAAQVGERQATWDALVAQPDSTPLFRLLDDLRSTADFTRAYDDLKGRVWKLLDAAAQDTTLREELFSLAAGPRGCADRAIMVFSNLEVQVLVHAAGLLASQQGVERGLLELGQGLFRLQEVERIAFALIERRQLVEPQVEVDEIEVRLAFRTGLADALELPGQPRGMNFRRSAGVTDAQIEAARVEVLGLETADALKAFLPQRAFWMDYLKKQYAQRFEAADQAYFHRMSALDVDRGKIRDQTYVHISAKLLERRDAEHVRIAQTLTVEIWNALPAQQTRL